MRRLIAGGKLSIALAAALAASVALAAQAAESTGLHQVRVLYVVPLGEDDAATSGREVLIEQLRKVGFEVTDRRESADATLSVTIRKKPKRKGLVVRIDSVVVRSPEGAVLWQRPVPSTGSVRYQARRVAVSLRSACRRSEWAAGRTGADG